MKKNRIRTAVMSITAAVALFGTTAASCADLPAIVNEGGLCMEGGVPVACPEPTTPPTPTTGPEGGRPPCEGGNCPQPGEVILTGCQLEPWEPACVVHEGGN